MRKYCNEYFCTIKSTERVNYSGRDLDSRIFYAAEVTYRLTRKSRTPNPCGETNSKIAFESCRRFRQVSPSAFEAEVRPVACLFATVGKRTEVRKRNSEKSARRKEEGRKEGEEGEKEESPSNRCKNAGNRRKS